MKKINVNNCLDCPFYEVHYDDFAVGNDTAHICKLKEHLDPHHDCFIKLYDSKGNDEEDTLITPEWCPLKQNDYKIEFNK